MEADLFYAELKDKFAQIVKKYRLETERVNIIGKVLQPQEAIGNPKRQDFPILKGKEKLMEADFKGSKGQAFTDMPGSFSGTIKEILKRPLETNFDRAILICTLNAVLNNLGLIQNTIHCKDEAPERCAEKLISFIKNNYPTAEKIALFGLQPAMAEKLSQAFTLRIVDLDPDNIGKLKFGISVEGEEKTDEVIKWCHLILATGSSIANGTLPRFLGQKPVLFYGTSLAGVSYLMNLERYCPESK